MRLRSILLSIVGVGFLAGCTSEETGTVATGDRVSPTYAGPAETTYCSTVTTYGTPVTITGTAEYKQRQVTIAGLGSAATAVSKPIRAAEVRVTDAAGAVIQCGETDATTGAFSIQIPQGSTSYTLSVNSRSYNGYLRASVLNKPEANAFYSLSTSVSGASSVSVGTLTAPADGTMTGAAFNILDQMFESTAFLRAQTSTCSASFAGCKDIDVDITDTKGVPKVVAYWEKGFNPNAYFSSNSGLSFYLPSYRRMFILGGINGDTDNTDTDHYDNSVIVHEYGHFLEDVMFASDSPGGSHNGNGVIDPRLAWSEGWGNFFQAAVIGQPYYRDTVGNADGSTYLAFNVDLEDSLTSTNAKDTPANAGEGNFREFSVSRLLWDTMDATPAENISLTGSLDNRSNSFPQIWASLTKATNGFRDTDFAFRNVGHLHLSQLWLESNAGGTDWSQVRTGNRHDGDTGEYAQYVETGVCADFQIDPAANTTSTSHFLYNNDFFHLRVTSTASYTFTLSYSDADSGGTEADLDLYIYNESARFGVSADILGSGRLDPDNNPATAQTETVTVTLSPGHYLINVNAYVGGTLSGAGPTNYNIKIGSNTLCPANLVQ